MKKRYKTTYKTAVEWLHNSLIRTNPDGDRLANLWENRRWDGDAEIYQWVLTDCSEGDVEFLEEHFGLLFSYDDGLECWVLAVDHWGTGWDYVAIDTDLKDAACEAGETPYARRTVQKWKYDADMERLKGEMEGLLKEALDENGRLVAENETLRDRLADRPVKATGGNEVKEG